MNINRHNYEEYFLLYIDNELSVDQKKQVELFVEQNPDVEEELVMLKQSRLLPDHSIVFDKKHLLMKEENASHSSNNSFINLNNYEQWLIMYVDDELTAEEKLAVERFAVSSPTCAGGAWPYFCKPNYSLKKLSFQIKKSYIEEKKQYGLLACNGGG